MAAEAKPECKEAFGEKDDDDLIVIEAEDKVGSPVAGRKGLSIDLNLAAMAAERRDAKELTEEEMIEQTNSTPVFVLFDLPDGSQARENKKGVKKKENNDP